MKFLVFLVFFNFCHCGLKNNEISASKSTRIELNLKNKESIIIKNDEKKFIGILFHSYPGKITITEKQKNDENIKEEVFHAQSGFRYFYHYESNIDLITITANEDELISFTLFVVDESCNEENVFTSSTPNVTYQFRLDKYSNAFKLKSNSNKFVLIDSGGEMIIEVSKTEHSQVTLNGNDINEKNEIIITEPAVIWIKTSQDFNSDDYVEITFSSQFAFQYQFQSKDPEDEKVNFAKNLSIVSSTIVAFCLLFVIFLIGVARCLKKIRKSTNSNNETENQFAPEMPDAIDQTYNGKSDYDNSYTTNDWLKKKKEKLKNSEMKVSESSAAFPLDTYNVGDSPIIETHAKKNHESDNLEESDENENEFDFTPNPYHNEELTCV